MLDVGTPVLRGYSSIWYYCKLSCVRASRCEGRPSTFILYLSFFKKQCGVIYWAGRPAREGWWLSWNFLFNSTRGVLLKLLQARWTLKAVT